MTSLVVSHGVAVTSASRTPKRSSIIMDKPLATAAITAPKITSRIWIRSRVRGSRPSAMPRQMNAIHGNAG